MSAGKRLRAALEIEHPLQVVGAITAYAARMAEATGFRALYLSGGGVAANSLGMPDLGISTMDDQSLRQAVIFKAGKDRATARRLDTAVTVWVRLSDVSSGLNSNFSSTP